MKERIYISDYDNRVGKMVDRVINNIKDIDSMSIDNYRELSSTLIEDVVFHDTLTLVKYYKHGVFFPTDIGNSMEFRKLRTGADINGVAIYSIIDDITVHLDSCNGFISHLVYSPFFAERRSGPEFSRVLKTMSVVFSHLKKYISGIGDVNFNIATSPGLSILVNIEVDWNLLVKE